MRATIWLSYGVGLMVGLALFLLMAIGAYLLRIQEIFGHWMWQ